MPLAKWRYILIDSFLCLLWSFILTCPGYSSSPQALQQIINDSAQIPSRQTILDLFYQCITVDNPLDPAVISSRTTLIEMGAIIVPTLLTGYLGTEDTRAKSELNWIITGIGYPTSQFLIPYLSSPSPSIRVNAAWLLGEVSSISAHENDCDPGPLPEDRAAIDALKASIEGETVVSVVSAELVSLGKMRDPGQIELLARYLHNQDETLRIGAVSALGYIPDQLVIAPLMSAFSDPQLSVRRSAVMALSSPFLGNIAFEALLGGAVMSLAGDEGQRCALQSLVLFLGSVEGEQPRPEQQRKRAFDIAGMIIRKEISQDSWALRGLAVDLIGYTNQPDAIGFLEGLRRSEKHPFVLQRIELSIDRLQKLNPAAEPE
jgi:HEAT repeat protein